jgi:hypothetical protein
MKNYIFWDITPCSPLKVNRHFGGTCHIHRLGRRVNQVRNQYKAGGKQILLSLLYNPEDEGDVFSRNAG